MNNRMLWLSCQTQVFSMSIAIGLKKLSDVASSIYLKEQDASFRWHDKK